MTTGMVTVVGDERVTAQDLDHGALFSVELVVGGGRPEPVRFDRELVARDLPGTGVALEHQLTGALHADRTARGLGVHVEEERRADEVDRAGRSRSARPSAPAGSRPSRSRSPSACRRRSPRRGRGRRATAAASAVKTGARSPTGLPCNGSIVAATMYCCSVSMIASLVRIGERAGRARGLDLHRPGGRARGSSPSATVGLRRPRRRHRRRTRRATPRARRAERRGARGTSDERNP